jgi:hypothetical protein
LKEAKMNQDQINSLIRTGAAFLGGVLATKGYVSAADAAVLVTAIITLSSALVTVVPAVWGILSHTREAKMTAVLALSPAERVGVLPPALLINAVNSDKTNGAKVVADNVANAGVPMIHAPVAIPPASAAGK